jgi:hypothetical protein
MCPCDHSAQPFRARLRSLFGRRLPAVAAAVILLMSGMPIPPEEIQERMRMMSKIGIAQVLEHEQQPSGDPPGEDEVN